MAEQDLDRSQAATPYKLQKARERGQVAKSADVVSFVVFTSAMVFLTWYGWPTWRDQFQLDRALLAQATRLDGSPAALWSTAARGLRSTLALSGPFFATLMLSAIAGHLLQSGPVLSLEPVKADWTRINPVTGLKRLMSLRTLFHGIRAVLKLALLGGVAYFALERLLARSGSLAALSPVGATRALLDGIASLGLRIALALGAIAALDLIYTRREFARQMRMSRRESKDEVRNREGDPRIRSRLRELRRELLKRALAVQRTRNADVLITNPTHVAVALRYVHGRMASPQLVAKGSGVVAAAMRKIAARHGVPIVPSPSLARAIFHDVSVDGSVPPDLYAAVARIVVWVFAMRDARRGTAGREAGRSAGLPAQRRLA